MSDNAPTYSLVEVQRVARLATVHRHKATRLIVERLGCSEPTAEALARGKLAALKPGNFVKADVQEFNPKIVADVYGLIDEDGGWFIKFYMENGRLFILSCHGPRWDLRCADGTVVKEQQP